MRITSDTLPDLSCDRIAASNCQCFGMCLITSTKPMTAMPRMCSSSFTPAAAIKSPPMPRIAMAGTRATKARATPEACKSPDGSPATIKMSRTERCLRLLDFAHDAERHFQRVPAVLARHDDWRLALDRRDEALVL